MVLHQFLKGTKWHPTPVSLSGKSHGQRSLVGCSPQGRKGSGTTERLTQQCQSRTSLVAQLVKNLSAMQETWIRSLGWEDLLEEGMATHSSILAWRIPMTEEGPGKLQSMGLQRVNTAQCQSNNSCFTFRQQESIDVFIAGARMSGVDAEEKVSSVWLKQSCP